LLIGDATKAKEKLGWTATTSFQALVTEMMTSDLAAAKKEASGGKGLVP
jgi:GDPmannose 4,6-dehydratase